MASQSSPLARVAAFVPEIVRALLETNPQPLVPPWSLSFEGAVVRVLVEGFAGLAETFAERAADGQRLMAQAVEGFFGERAAVVHAYGGSTVLMDGHGLLLLFPASASPEARFLAGRAALGACLQIRGSAGPGSRGRLGVRGPSIDVRIGAHLGPITLGAVGTDGWHFVLAGAALEQADAAALRARPGELMATDGLLGWVGTVRTEGTFHAGSASVIGLPPPDDRLEPVTAGLRGGSEELHSRLLDAVPAELREDRAEEAEPGAGRFERAAVLHVLVDGLGSESPEAIERLHELASRAQESCAGLEGRLDSAGIDSSQSWLSASFPERDGSAANVRAALHAALDLRRRLALPGLRGLHLSVGEGTVYRTAIGGPGRRQLGLIGPPVEAALRLAALAPVGQILVAEPLHELAGSLFEFERLRVRTTPGGQRAREGARRTQSRELLALARSLDPLRRASGEPPLVARDVELAMCESIVLEAEQGRGAALMLRGSRGSGKSRLLHAAARRAEESGLLVAQAAAAPAADPMDLAALRELLSALRAARAMGSDEAADAPAADGAALARQLVQEMREASDAAPLLLVLDDLHRASPLAQSLAQKMATRLGSLRVALLLAAEPEMPAEPGLELVELPPLEPEEVEELARHLREGRPLEPELVEPLTQHSGGNPLHVAELLHALELLPPVERTAEALASLPAELRALVHWRIERLEPSLRETLALASALELPAPLEALQAAHPEPATLSTHMGLLGARGFPLVLRGEAPVLVDFGEALHAEVLRALATV
jgi:class 3 adenylate cyclase